MKRESWLTHTGHLTAGLLLAVLVGLGACQRTGTAQCGTAPARPMLGFIVTTTTGSDSTDADIEFCYTRKSGGAEECHPLDEPFADDFEPHEVNTFKWNVMTPIAPGDLAEFVIRNRGHGFLDNGWGMDGLRVDATLEGGETVMLYEEKLSEHLDTGDSYDSSQCAY